MNYIDALRKTSKKLDAEFNESELIIHSPSKGTFREYIVKNCIRPFLPDAYGISNKDMSFIDWKTLLLLWQIFLMSVKTLCGECSKWI